MCRIKHVLWERRIAWLQAKAIAKKAEEKQKILESEDPAVAQDKIAELEQMPIAYAGRRLKKRRIAKRLLNKRPKDRRSTSWTVV
jgi:hypothetical protein